MTHSVEIILPTVLSPRCRESARLVQWFLSLLQCCPDLRTSRRAESEGQFIFIFFHVDINSFVYFCKSFSKEDVLAALHVNIT